MASRRISDLRPELSRSCEQHLERCKQVGVELLITCTYRDNLEQQRLYDQGRTTPGRIVTNARPGESKHNIVTASGKPYAEAYDVVPIRDGKAIWDPTDQAWTIAGEIGESLGLEWAGRWKTFREYPHFQWKR